MHTDELISDSERVERYLAAHQNQIMMDIGDSESLFSFWQDNTLTQVVLPIGFAAIAERHFPHTPPTYDDIEYAINDIEDEIEKVASLIPHQDYQLVTQNEYIRQLALACFVQESPTMLLSRTALERLFGEYAEIVTGRPPRDYEPDISPLFYAKLLIFREYFHHLKFTEVTILPSICE